MHFEIVLLGCPVTPTKACNGKAQLNIRSLGGKASKLEVTHITQLKGDGKEGNGVVYVE